MVYIRNLSGPGRAVGRSARGLERRGWDPQKTAGLRQAGEGSESRSSHTYMCIYIYMYIYACIHVYIYIYIMYICIFVYMYICYYVM